MPALPPRQATAVPRKGASHFTGAEGLDCALCQAALPSTADLEELARIVELPVVGGQP